MLTWVHRHDHLPPRTLREVLRDVLARAILPSVLLALVNLLVGWVVMGPLGGFAAEASVNAALQAGRTPLLDTVARAASTLGSTPYAIGTALVGAVVVARVSRRWVLAVPPLAALATEGWLHAAVSVTINRPRPPVEQLDMAQPTASFPSGHVGANLALWLCFALLAIASRHRWRRWVVVPYAVVFIGLLAWSRLYLGMHFPVDTAVGVLNGVACGVLGWSCLRRDPR